MWGGHYIRILYMRGGHIYICIQGLSMWGGHYIKIPYIGDIIYKNININILYVEWPLHKDFLYVDAIYVYKDSLCGVATT